MKLPLLLLPVLALLSPVLRAESQMDREIQQLNEQRDRAVAAAMVPINRNYQAGLQQLLKRAVDAHDLDANAKIIEMLRGVAPSSAEAAPAATSGQTALAARVEALLIGTKWLHMNAFHYTFTKGGSVILAENHPRGKYRINGQNGAVTIHWEGGLPDNVMTYDEKTNGFTLTGGPFVPITK